MAEGPLKSLAVQIGSVPMHQDVLVIDTTLIHPGVQPIMPYDPISPNSVYVASKDSHAQGPFTSPPAVQLGKVLPNSGGSQPFTSPPALVINQTAQVGGRAPPAFRAIMPPRLRASVDESSRGVRDFNVDDLPVHRSFHAPGEPNSNEEPRTYRIETVTPGGYSGNRVRGASRHSVQLLDCPQGYLSRTSSQYAASANQSVVRNARRSIRSRDVAEVDPQVLLQLDPSGGRNPRHHTVTGIPENPSSFRRDPGSAELGDGRSTRPSRPSAYPCAGGVFECERDRDPELNLSVLIHSAIAQSNPSVCVASPHVATELEVKISMMGLSLTNSKSKSQLVKHIPEFETSCVPSGSGSKSSVRSPRSLAPGSGTGDIAVKTSSSGLKRILHLFSCFRRG